MATPPPRLESASSSSPTSLQLARRISDPLSALKRKIEDGELDIGKCLWQAANSGSVETLELVLQLPLGRINTL